MAITRRGVLAAVGGLGLAAGGGVGLAVMNADVNAPMTDAERATIAAVAVTWFSGEPFPIAGDHPDVLDAIEKIVADTLAAPQRVAFRGVVRTLQLGTIATRGRTFADLTPEERRAVLVVWSDPSVLPRRVALDSLRAVVGMAYFRQPSVRQHIGCRQECGVSVGRRGLQSRGGKG